MNKTPIQELIDHVYEYYGTCVVNDYEWLQKEKQFAFDCFEAGNRFGMDVCGSFDWGQQPTKPDFDEFYSKYVSQHTK